MGKKLYIRNFPSDADEKTLFRQFGKKKVEKVDIIEKKDENGEIISRFCYLYTFLDEQEKLILYESYCMSHRFIRPKSCFTGQAKVV